MNKKILVAAVLVLAVLAGLGYYYGGETLQGRFDKTLKGSKTPDITNIKGKSSGSSDASTDTNYLLTVTPKDGTPQTQTAYLSDVATASYDESWYTIGYWKMELDSSANSCSEVEFAVSTSDGHKSYLSEIARDTRVLVRDSSMDTVGDYLSPSNSTTLSAFNNLSTEQSGSYYIQLDVYPDSELIDAYMDNKMSVYMTLSCVNTADNTYYWFKNDEADEIDMNEDSSGLGNIGGYFYIRD